MIVIDSNTLIVLIIGMIDPNLIDKHKKTSIYDKTDYNNLLTLISDLKKIVVLPNIWTEVDNSLHRFKGGHKWQYVESMKYVIKQTSEKFIQSKKGVDSQTFISLGLTDSVILELALDSEYLITSDSTLSDYAKAAGIKVFDLVEMRNMRLRN